MPRTTVHHFGACELDEARRQLSRDGTAVRVGPRVFDLLVLLVRNAHRVVPRNELRVTVWSDQSISDTALHACVCRAREAIGDRDDAQPMIRTYPRYGYRFAGDVRTEWVGTAPRLESAHAARGDSAAAAPSSAGFVGRAAELATVTAALDRALAGAGSSVVICGEHGVGKTRFADEVGRAAEARGFELLWGHCTESESPPSFWPWAQIVRRYASRHQPEMIRAALGSAAVDVARIAPALRDRCPELAEGVPADPDQAQVRVHQSLLDFVGRAAAAEPLLLIVDDLQWADAASLRVLQALREELSQSRAVLIALREPLDGQAHADAEASTRSPPSHIELAGLDATAMRELIGHRLGRQVPAGFARTLTELAAGNPLVAIDVARHLGAAGLLPPAQSAWPKREAIVEAGLPDSTRAMVEHRMSHLDAAGRRVLAIAAVAGDAFAFDAVDRVAALAGDRALPAIEAAARARFVAALDGDGASYRFTAPYLRQAIIDGLNPTRRAHVRAQLASGGARTEDR